MCKENVTMEAKYRLAKYTGWKAAIQVSPHLLQKSSGLTFCCNLFSIGGQWQFWTQLVFYLLVFFDLKSGIEETLACQNCWFAVLIWFISTISDTLQILCLSVADKWTLFECFLFIQDMISFWTIWGKIH